MHAAYLAPQGAGCECAPAPCGGAIARDDCNWHRNAANLWHRPEDCDRIRAKRDRKATARPGSQAIVDAIHNAHTN